MNALGNLHGKVFAVRTHVTEGEGQVLVGIFKHFVFDG